MEIIQYNEKTLLLKGNTKPYKEELKKMRARFNYGLGGWIYPSKMRKELEAFVDRHTDKRAKQLVLW
jgi:CRISPR/Cas system CSM-associated protein Csm4 (group 5 of RAMP superfamily)